MTKKLVSLTAEELAVLDNSYPVSTEEQRLSLPRLGLLSKDLIEETGKGKEKTIKILESAGTFYTEKDLGKVDEKTGKKVWTKEFIGDSISVFIIYERRQLRKFDASLKKFISTPIFDNKDQVIPLFLDKQVIKRGTPEMLQSMYPALTAKGKPSSDLKEETILFVVYQDELYQCGLSQSSKWGFKDYKKGLNPSKVLTELSSSEETFGTNTYRKMKFKNVRNITQEELDMIYKFQGDLKHKADSDAEFFLQNADQKAIGAAKDAALDAYGNEAMK